MDKYIIDERNGWEYELNGDYYYPTGRIMRNGVMTPNRKSEDDEPEEVSIGIWGQRHATFLKKYRRSVYNGLVFSGRLNSYLAQIDREAQEMFDLLIRQLAEQEGITEQLKADNQMAWLGAMNNIRERVCEIVLNEVIFT